ncbi:DUF488 domain-containing protein [Tsukamurella sp. 1534]|uniref:DUF488 domain-containing protein n=1 Tax=Tsukamurella sp. 1534 TaxID=1151061 RepID=UPI00031BD401|nr:DUF488 domain-containing protein [Tsukamurella sp. 1534]
MTIYTKRIYEEAAAEDGYRVLVDRLWPRGVSKERAHLDLWDKQVAPSPGLREWFGHDPAKFDEFRDRYTEELTHNPAAEELERIVAQKGVVTLLYAARDPACQHASVLADYLREHQDVSGRQ